ncbi:MAG: alpha-amylase family glycosyl hydrolase [Anaerolineae bacterium]|jgi:glycosidase|nr:alpha-amylase family glycosyl hydrolase [Anaerolineae bacterium]
MKRLLTCFVLLFVLLLSACNAAPADKLEKTTAEEYGYPWWNDVTFYQVFVRSFYDSDGDGLGDINGLIEKLDYLNDGDPETDTDLEVTGLWLMPMLPSPSYHGYNVTDFKAIDEDYGTMEDFERLLEECHKRGMVVILDWEINHTGLSHPWFQESKDPESEYHDWYIWEDDNPGWGGPWGQDVWHYDTTTGKYYYGIFWSGMPDLNYENPEVTAAMYDAVQFWLVEKGVDGLRIDAARHLIEEGSLQESTEATHEWFQDFFVWYKEEAPDAMTIGEVWTSSEEASVFVKNDELDMVFSFDLAGEMIMAAKFGSGRQFSQSIEAELLNFPDYQMGTFLTNHDQARTMTELGGDYGKAMSAATALLTAPGVPFIYYGEEIGMAGGKPDENIRRPMQWDDSQAAGFTTATIPWNLPQTDYKEKNVALQTEDPASLLNHYRKLVNIRNQYPALRVGDYTKIMANDISIYAALRTTEEEKLLIIANMSAEPVSDYHLILNSGIFNETYTAYDLFNGEKLKAADISNDTEEEFFFYTPYETIPPYTTYILWLQD